MKDNYDFNNMKRIPNRIAQRLGNKTKPADVKLPHEPIAMGTLTPAQINDELEKGYAGALAGRHRSIKNVAGDMARDYD
jgi:hypothetical protein